MKTPGLTPPCDRSHARSESLTACVPRFAALLTALLLLLLGPALVREAGAQCPVGINMGLHEPTKYLSANESEALIRGAGFSSLKIFAPSPEVFAALAGRKLPTTC